MPTVSIRSIAVAVALAFVLYGSHARHGASATTAAKPNFLLILADDLGWTDLGCFGSDFYETPHLDALASSGVRLTSGYAACPVCSPTRVAFQTGINPTRLAATEWFGGPQPHQASLPRFEKRFRNRRLLPAPYVDKLPLEEQTLAEVFAAHGYRTFFAGKWHLGGEGHWPEDQGYQFNFGGHHKGSPPGGYFSPYKNPALSDGPQGEHLPARLAQESATFLTEHRDQPFVLVLSFYSVHTPLQGRKDLVEKYRAKKTARTEDLPEFVPDGRVKNRIVQNHAVYAAMVEAMDEAVGEVLAALRESGVSDNTFVLFTSDNGGLSTAEGSPTSNVPLRTGKGWLYEGGIRVPWIVRWPGVTKPGSVSKSPVISHDILPTLLDVADVAPDADARFDGTSFASLLADTTIERQRDLYWHYPHYSNQGGGPGSAIRSGNWKLIDWKENDRVELYHLAEDLEETRDLAEAHPEMAEELLKKLATWKREVGAREPTVNPAFGR